MTEGWIWLAALVLGLHTVLLLVLLLRRAPGAAQTEQMAQATQSVLAALQAQAERLDRLERELRRDLAESARDSRQEAFQSMATFQQTLTQQSAEATRTQNTQIDAFGQQLAGLQKKPV